VRAHQKGGAAVSEEAEAETADDAGATQQKKPEQENNATECAKTPSAQEMRLAAARRLWECAKDANGVLDVNRAMRVVELMTEPRTPAAKGARRGRAANDGGSADEDTLELPLIVHRFVAPGDPV
jgi:hypothetical protein